MGRDVKVRISGEDKVTGVFGKAGSAVKKFSSVVKEAATAFAGLFAARKVLDFLGDTITEATNAERIWRRLGVAVSNAGVSFEQQRGRLENLAKQLQRTSRFGDEDFAETLGTLVGISGDYEGSLKAVTIATGLAVKQQMDLQAAAILIGKAMVGETGSLSRYGIVLDKNKDILAQLAEATKGYTEASGKDLEGTLARLTNGFGDLKEAIGKALFDTDAASVSGDRLVGVMQRMEEWVTRNHDAFGRWETKILGVAEALGGLYQKMLNLPPFKLWRMTVGRLFGMGGEAGVEQHLGFIPTPPAPSKPRPPETPEERKAREAREARTREALQGGDFGSLSLSPQQRDYQDRVDRARQDRQQEDYDRSRAPGLRGGIGITSGDALIPQDVLDKALPKMQELDGVMGSITQGAEKMRDAFVEGFSASAAGAENLEDATIGAVGKALKGVAKLKQKEQLAEAADDFAAGLFPPNPAAIAAGFKHLAAAQLWGVIGGGSGGGGGAGSRASVPVNGGLNPGRLASDQQALAASRGEVVVRVPREALIRPTDPAWVDFMAETMREAKGRNVRLEVA